jgi:hypothetical protein
MSREPIRSILIAGGGTAGWLSAAYLQRALGSSVQIRLVESENIPRIGVGEATVSTLRFTMSFLGFSEEAWMPEVHATYKTAIRFEQWNRPAEAGEEHFYHPFFERNEPLVSALPLYFPEIGEGISLMHFWHRAQLAGDPTPYAEAVFPGPHICDARKAPRFVGSSKHEIPSAYHLDAHRFGQFLMKHAVARGVERVADDISEVLIDERGFVAGVRTAEHGVLKADLYLDCTGFHRVLLARALREPFVSAADYLWCDSAVAMRPQNAPGELEPYTTARAAHAGWMWNIPLLDRSGTGYVYASAFQGSSEAEHELRSYLGARAAEDSEAMHIRFTPGRCERTWVNNCVAIGLSANFIEPLESTTIFLIEYALAHLVSLFPDREFAPARAARYNRQMRQMFDEVRDFIVLHYVGSRRNDTAFWRALSEQRRVPDSLAEQLAFYRESLPSGERFNNFVFRERSYACILAGLGMLPKEPCPLLAHVSDAEARLTFAAIRERSADLARRLPGQRELLEHMQRAAATVRS